MGMKPTSSVEARVRLFPQLSYHYGLSFTELFHLPGWVVDIYIEELPRLLAEQHQAALEAAAYPNFKKQDQQRIQRRLAKVIGGRRSQAPKVDIVGNPDSPTNPLAGMVGVEIVQ